MTGSIVEYLNQFEVHRAGITALSGVLGFDATGLVTFLVFLSASLVMSLFSYHVLSFEDTTTIPSGKTQ